MFRPFQYPNRNNNNNNRRQMQNQNRQTNRQSTGQPGQRKDVTSIMYPTDAEFNAPQARVVDTFHETMAFPNIVPVVNGDAVPVQTSEEEIADFLRLNPKKGYLKVKTATARGAVPIYNAIVTIYKADTNKSYLIATETTDLDGLTLPIPLPAPDKNQSFNPENPRPYADYDIVVEHPEYKNVELKNIPVFDGITSIQNVNMIAFKDENPPTVINEGPTEPGR